MRTILFADDNKGIREFCRSVLEEEGYRVLVARDGVDAVAVFGREEPDLLILDLSMPRAGGFDAMQRIKAIRPEVPVILFTAYDEDCTADPRSGLAAACVEKSEDLTELKRAVVIALKTAAIPEACRCLRSGLPPLADKCEPAERSLEDVGTVSEARRADHSAQLRRDHRSGGLGRQPGAAGD